MTRVHYLYHNWENPRLNQAQQGVNDLKHGHHLTEVHHVGCGVERIVE